MDFLPTLVIVIGIFHKGEGLVKLFDCNSRPTQACENSGTCVTTTGLCDSCATDFVGFACHVGGKNADDPATTCSDGCNTGTCLQAGGCYCPPDWTGDKCQTQSVKLTCEGTPPGDANNMILDVSKLKGAEQAQVIVMGADKSVSDDDRCFGTAGAALTVLNVFSSPAATTTCPSAVKTTVNGNDVYKRGFLVRFTDGVTSTQTDFVVNAECGPDGPVIEIKKSFQTTNTASSLQSVVRSNTVAGASVTASLTDAGGNPITSSSQFNLDEVITITVQLDMTNSNFAAIQLKTFKVDNGETTNPKEILLIENYCPTTKARLVIKTGPTKATSIKTVLECKPVIIDPTDVNMYTLEIFVCKTGDEANCQHTCGSRRKRSADNDDDVALMSVGFNVIDSTRLLNTHARKHTDDKNDCAMAAEITASLVAMGVAILLLLVLVIILVMRAVMANRREVTVYEHQRRQNGSEVSLPKMISSNY